MLPNWKTNRIKSTEPRLGKFYCWGCDRKLIGKGEKCPVCGKKDLNKNRKK